MCDPTNLELRRRAGLLVEFVHHGYSLLLRIYGTILPSLQQQK